MIHSLVRGCRPSADNFESVRYDCLIILACTTKRRFDDDGDDGMLLMCSVPFLFSRATVTQGEHGSAALTPDRANKLIALGFQWVSLGCVERGVICRNVPKHHMRADPRPPPSHLLS